MIIRPTKSCYWDDGVRLEVARCCVMADSKKIEGLIQ